MSSFRLKFTVSLAVLMLAACGNTKGNWPNLSDPIPAASERERVIKRALPVKSERPIEISNNSPMNVSLAIKLVTTVKAEVKTATATYQDAKNSIEATEGEEKIIVWHEAQLLLTRLSKSTDRLDSLIYSAKLKGESIWVSGSAFKNAQDKYVAAERQLLAKIKP